MKQQYAKDLLGPAPAASKEAIVQAALSIVLRDQQATRAAAARAADSGSPTWTLGAHRLNGVFTEQLLLKDGARTLRIDVRHNPNKTFDVTVRTPPAARFLGGRVHLDARSSHLPFFFSFLCARLGQAYAGKERVAVAEQVLGRLGPNSAVELEIDGHRTSVAVTEDENELHVFGQDGARVTFELVPPSFLDQAASVSAGSVYTPMPCKISQVQKRRRARAP